MNPYRTQTLLNVRFMFGCVGPHLTNVTARSGGQNVVWDLNGAVGVWLSYVHAVGWG